jgi:hypothetical protein
VTTLSPFNPASAEFRADPIRLCLATAGGARLPPEDAGWYVLSRYADVRALRNHEVFSSAQGTATGGRARA